MAYSPPSGNVTTAVQTFSWINESVSNMFFPGIILVTYFIILIKMLTNPNNTAGKSFAAASFMMMIVSVFARLLDFVSTNFMTIFVVLTAVGGIWMHIENAS